MKFVKSTTPADVAAQYVGDKIVSNLAANNTVLWLLSGGSGTQIALKAAEILAGHNLSNLLVSMTDERYGAVGHVDENWQQLLDAGFSLPGAQLYRPLKNLDRSTTAHDFEDWLVQAIDRADYRIGIFGIGTDGHTAGIKPDSPATDAEGLADDFTADDYDRITMTFPAIRRLDEIVVQASGKAKAPVLQRLRLPDQSLSSFPAAILQQIPKVSIYTDIDV